MAQILSELLEFVKELIAIWHWISNLGAFLTLISERGITGGMIVWLISGFLSAIVSEIIRTSIPSYLRPIFKYLFD
jgi:hypothetical protein